MQGIIALDIDGTITSVRTELPSSVQNYLFQIHQQGWKILFVTGRTYSWAHRLLGQLHFEYGLSVQNGALSLDMPSKHVIRRAYLSVHMLHQLEEIMRNEANEFIVYTGIDYDERCYWRPNRFSKPMLEHLTKRQRALEEKWIEVNDFTEIPSVDFASVRIFGSPDEMARISSKIHIKLNISSPTMIDSYDIRYRIAQVTHKEATKGKALQHYWLRQGKKGVCIAAGDDYNDVSMLSMADIGIAMQGAPKELLDLADIIAPSAQEMGIIIGLQQAVEMATCGNKKKG